MSDYQMIWMVILAGGLASYGFRILPQLILGRFTLDAERSRLFRFFDYAAYAVIGGLIASSLLGGGTDLLTQLRTAQVQAGAIAVAVTFTATLISGRQLIPIVFGLGAYLLVRILLG